LEVGGSVARRVNWASCSEPKPTTAPTRMSAGASDKGSGERRRVTVHFIHIAIIQTSVLEA
jgi:hypothetical protein